MKHVHEFFLSTCLLIVLSTVVLAEIPLSSTPIWQRSGSGNYPTGVGWADINSDGWLDLVLSNGLDQAVGPAEVYFNAGGTLESLPGWSSVHEWGGSKLCLADFDHSGDPDIVISALGVPGVQQTHCVFYNDEGTFPIVPDWNSQQGKGFSCAIGDPDGDGDIDVVFGQRFRASNPNNNAPMHIVLYFNEDGMFAEEPGWQSEYEYNTIDVAFVDIDLDDDHDLIATTNNEGIKVFYNNDGELETIPSVEIQTITGGRQIALGDVNSDGYPDLAVACLGNYFKLFLNDEGTFDPNPAWTSGALSEPCCVCWADVDNDGDPDLGAGTWFSGFGVFENVDGVLGQSYSWSYTLDTWAQLMAWGDMDADGLTDTTESFLLTNNRSLFYLPHKPVHEISSVEVNGAALELDEFCYDPCEGWVSLAEPCAGGSTVTVNYTWSGDLELAVTTCLQTRVFSNTQQAQAVDVNILVILGDDIGSNYHFTRVETPPTIRDYFENWGWNLTHTAVTARVDSCHSYGAYFGCSSIEVDTLIWDIENISYYDIITVIPGSSHQGLIDSPEAMQLIRDAVDAGIVVSAWCRGVRTLAYADVIDGVDIVGHSDFEDEYIAAGANYLGHDHPPVTDGSIVTGARSRYYRAEIAQAMYDAVVASVEVEEYNAESPYEYKLSQCYPNPFNGTTTIQFSLPDPGHVRLSVYDILGREVLQLVDQPLSTGNHSYRVHAESLASGVYFYQLNTEIQSEVRKMLLLR